MNPKEEVVGRLINTFIIIRPIYTANQSLTMCWALYWGYTKNLWIVYFKRVNFIVCELYLKGEKQSGISFPVPHSPLQPSQSQGFTPVSIRHCGGDVKYSSWTGQLLILKFTGDYILGHHKGLRQDRGLIWISKCAHGHTAPLSGTPPAVSLAFSVVWTCSPHLSSMQYGVANTIDENLYFLRMYPSEPWLQYCSIVSYHYHWGNCETSQGRTWPGLSQKQF